MAAVKAGRAKRVKTPEDIMAGAWRMIAAVEELGKNEDPWVLAEMTLMRAELRAAETRVAASLRERSYRWSDIAWDLRTTAVTACKRYAPGITPAVAAAAARHEVSRVATLEAKARAAGRIARRRAARRRAKALQTPAGPPSA